MDSIVVLEIYNKEGTLIHETKTKNLVTNDGDLYYTKKVVGEDTLTDFPKIVLHLGGDAAQPIITPSKTDTEIPYQFAELELKATYTEPLTSFVYKFYIPNPDPSLQGKTVQYMGLSNGDAANPKLINTLVLDDPVVFDTNLLYLFTVKHTIFFPGTEDNLFMSLKEVQNKEQSLDYPAIISLPDLESNSQYEIVPQESPLTKDETLDTYFYSGKTKENTFSCLIYKSWVTLNRFSEAIIYLTYTSQFLKPGNKLPFTIV